MDVIRDVWYIFLKLCYINWAVYHVTMALRPGVSGMWYQSRWCPCHADRECSLTAVKRTHQNFLKLSSSAKCLSKLQIVTVTSLTAPFLKVSCRWIFPSLWRCNCMIWMQKLHETSHVWGHDGLHIRGGAHPEIAIDDLAPEVQPLES